MIDINKIIKPTFWDGFKDFISDNKNLIKQEDTFKLVKKAYNFCEKYYGNYYEGFFTDLIYILLKFQKENPSYLEKSNHFIIILLYRDDCLYIDGNEDFAEDDLSSAVQFFSYEEAKKHIEENLDYYAQYDFNKDQIDILGLIK